MSEFGNETATAAIRLSKETLEALLKLLRYLMEHNERKIDRELKKEKLEKIQGEKEARKIKEYLNKKNGNVRANMLYKSGEKLIPLKIPMSVKELREFEKYSQIYGLVYTSIANKSISEEIKILKKQIKSEEDKVTRDNIEKKINELEKQREKRIVIVRERDLELVKDVTDRINMDIKLKDIEEEREKAEKNGENELCEQMIDKETQLKQTVFEKFNSLSNKAVIAEAIGEEVEEKIDFNRAISSLTSLKELDKITVLCERTKPDNYIEVTSIQDNYLDGREFINTEYKVFNNGIQQKCSEFKHGKFTHYSDMEGKNSSEVGAKHWKNVKDEMKTKGDFSDDILIFDSKTAYEQYVEKIKKIEAYSANREDTISYEADNESYKDCMGIINRLQGQLSEHNMMLNSQMNICNSKTKQILKLNANMTDDEKIQYAEGINIVKQIKNYTRINELQNNIEMKKFEQREDQHKYNNINNDVSKTELYEKSQQEYKAEIDKMQKELTKCNEEAKKLEIQQKRIESLTMVGVFEVERALVEETLDEIGNIEVGKNKEYWEKEIHSNVNDTVKENSVEVNTTDINIEHSIE